MTNLVNWDRVAGLPVATPWLDTQVAAAKHQGVPNLSPTERVAVDALAAAVRRCLGAELVDLRLFGSRARGEGNEDSDVDVAVIVTHVGVARRRQVHDLAHDIGLQYGVALAPLVLSEGRLAELRERERRIATDLDREGVPL